MTLGGRRYSGNIGLAGDGSQGPSIPPRVQRNSAPGMCPQSAKSEGHQAQCLRGRFRFTVFHRAANTFFDQSHSSCRSHTEEIDLVLQPIKGAPNSTH